MISDDYYRVVLCKRIRGRLSVKTKVLRSTSKRMHPLLLGAQRTERKAYAYTPPACVCSPLKVNTKPLYAAVRKAPCRRCHACAPARVARHGLPRRRGRQPAVGILKAADSLPAEWTWSRCVGSWEKSEHGPLPKYEKKHTEENRCRHAMRLPKARQRAGPCMH